MNDPEFAYAAYAKCGCLVGLTVDRQDKDTAEAVAEWITDGCSIERFPLSKRDEILKDGFGCKCAERKRNEQQPSLPEVEG